MESQAEYRVKQEETIFSNTDNWRSKIDVLFQSFYDYALQTAENGDIEHIHQTRVYARKLLTILDLTPDKDNLQYYPYLVKAINQTRKKLGRLRNIDVMIASFKKRRKRELKTKNKLILDSFLQFQKSERSSLIKQSRVKLYQLVNPHLKFIWQLFLEKELPMIIPTIDLKSHIALHKEQLYHHFEIAMKQQQDGNTTQLIEELHHVRIIGKKIRYISMYLGFAIYSSENDAQINEEMSEAHSLTQIQEVLGNINDYAVWKEYWQKASPELLNISKEGHQKILIQLETESDDLIKSFIADETIWSGLTKEE